MSDPNLIGFVREMQLLAGYVETHRLNTAAPLLATADRLPRCSHPCAVKTCEGLVAYAIVRLTVLLTASHGIDSTRALDRFSRLTVSDPALRLRMWIVETMPSGRCSAAEEARRIVESSYMAPLTVPGLARQVGVCRSTLVKEFRAAYGRSIKRYLTEVRLDHARELLTSTNLKIEAVAVAVGYRSKRHFYKQVAGVEGLTPGKVRRRTKEGD